VTTISSAEHEEQEPAIDEQEVISRRKEVEPRTLWQRVWDVL